MTAKPQYFAMLKLVRNKLSAIIQLDYHEIIQQALQDKYIQDEIIRLNTLDQLFDKGENSLGIRLENEGGIYSQITINRKSQLGQPFDHITLKDTGAFYQSFEVIANTGETYATIKANSIKDGKDILDRWGVEVIGLNPENTQWLRNEIKNWIIERIKQEYQAA